MSKQWYFQVMGAEVGPLSPAELADKVKRGQIQADTQVRKGADGKWMSADRIKGLLQPVPEDIPSTAPTTPVVASVTSSEQPVSSVVEVVANNEPANEDEATYHLNGVQSAASVEVPKAVEFDFFQFVGFRQAITPPLHEALEAYSRQHQMTFTQITRRALSQFLGKPELGEDKPNEPQSTPENS